MLATDFDGSRQTLAHRINALGALFEWLAKPPRFNMHLTPTSAARPNLVEKVFRDVTIDGLQRGVFTSATDLEATINEYVVHHSTKPNPFIWTQSARNLSQKVIRAKPCVSGKQNETLHCGENCRWLYVALEKNKHKETIGER